MNLYTAKVALRHMMVLAICGGSATATRLWLRRARRPRPHPGTWRILVVRPDHLGDLLFATPALDRLRQALPTAHITALVGPWGAPMWKDNPALNCLQVVPFPGISGERTGSLLAPYTLLGRLSRRLAMRGYDSGIVLRFDHWWGAALLWAAGIPVRWGYGTPGMGLWLNRKVRYVPGKHEVEQNLYLMQAMVRAMAGPSGLSRVGPLYISRREGRPPLRPPEPAAPPQDVMAGWADAPYRVVIHPGSGAANKLWTIRGWAEIAARLAAEGRAVALTGSAGERMLTDAIASEYEALHAQPGRGGNPPVHLPQLYNLAGRTADLHQLVWVLQHAHIVLGVDSGPLHIAAALHKPTLHLYGPSDEAIWGPWGDPRLHRTLRAPGTRPTMKLDTGAPALQGGPDMQAITVDMVMAAIRELMGECERMMPDGPDG